jgi:hypothetical protein
MADPQKDEEPKKDRWDRADIVIKALIPGVVAFIRRQIQMALTTQNTGKDYITIVARYSQKEDLPEEMHLYRNLARGLLIWPQRST